MMKSNVILVIKYKYNKEEIRISATLKSTKAELHSAISHKILPCENLKSNSVLVFSKAIR
jgi:hypothetical protein